MWCWHQNQHCAYRESPVCSLYLSVSDCSQTSHTSVPGGEPGVSWVWLAVLCPESFWDAILDFPRLVGAGILVGEGRVYFHRSGKLPGHDVATSESCNGIRLLIVVAASRVVVVIVRHQPITLSHGGC